MAKFRIKQVIAARGMTVKSAAEKIGITPQSLTNIIHGKGSPNVATIEKIAEALEVPVASLFEDYISHNSTIVICPHCGGRIDIKTGEMR